MCAQCAPLCCDPCPTHNQGTLCTGVVAHLPGVCHAWVAGEGVTQEAPCRLPGDPPPAAARPSVGQGTTPHALAAYVCVCVCAGAVAPVQLPTPIGVEALQLMCHQTTSCQPPDHHSQAKQWRVLRAPTCLLCIAASVAWHAASGLCEVYQQHIHGLHASRWRWGQGEEEEEEEEALAGSAWRKVAAWL